MRSIHTWGRKSKFQANSAKAGSAPELLEWISDSVTPVSEPLIFEYVGSDVTHGFVSRVRKCQNYEIGGHDTCSPYDKWLENTAVHDEGTGIRQKYSKWRRTTKVHVGLCVVQKGPYIVYKRPRSMHEFGTLPSIPELASNLVVIPRSLRGSRSLRAVAAVMVLEERPGRLHTGRQ